MKNINTKNYWDGRFSSNDSKSWKKNDGDGKPTHSYWSMMPSVMWDLYEKMNGFDPDFFMYYEETELTHRVKRSNGNTCLPLETIETKTLL